MSNHTSYRDWTIHTRPGSVSCVVESPYGVLTTATVGEGAEEKAREIIDALIEDYYPDGPMGRYPPPTGFHRKPGQPEEGVGFVAGAQRLSQAESRTVCFSSDCLG